MFGAMLPRGASRTKLSRMNMGGIGTAMMKKIMKDKNIESVQAMMEKAMQNGLKIIACSMSMDVMGIRPEELIDGVEIGGVGSYLGDAKYALADDSGFLLTDYLYDFIQPDLSEPPFAVKRDGHCGF